MASRPQKFCRLRAVNLRSAGLTYEQIGIALDVSTTAIYYALNPEKHKARRDRFYQQNREACRAASREWRARNPERARRFAKQSGYARYESAITGVPAKVILARLREESEKLC